MVIDVRYYILLLYTIIIYYIIYILLYYYYTILYYISYYTLPSLLFYSSLLLFQSLFSSPSLLPLLFSPILPTSSFILYLSVLTYGYLYSSVHSSSSFHSSLPSQFFLFSPHLSSSSIQSIYSSSSSSQYPPNIHSILVGTYIYLFIFFQSFIFLPIRPRTFYRSGWLRCDVLNSWEWYRYQV
jgi:hypothetical protein